MTLFNGKKFVFELGNLSSKEKAVLRKKIEANGGEILFALSKLSTSYVVTTSIQWQKQSFKLRGAQKYQIPIVDTSFIDCCIRRQTILPSFLFAPHSKHKDTEESLFSLDKEETPFFIRTPVHISNIKSEPYEPNSNENKYSIAAQHFLLKTNQIHGKYCALELHICKSVLETSGYKDGNEKQFRVFIHSGLTKELLLKSDNSQKPIGKKEIYNLNSIEEAESLYEEILNRYLQKQSFRPYQLISSRIGSGISSNIQSHSDSTTISIIQESVQNLVSNIYDASTFKTEEILRDTFGSLKDSPIGRLSLQDIEKAESTLCRLFNILSDSSICIPYGLQQSLEEEFTEIIFQSKSPMKLDSLDGIRKQQQLCQLLKDGICCNEGLDSGLLIDRKFAALSCNIQPLSERNPKAFATLKQEILESVQDKDSQDIHIREIFQLERESENFHSKFGNVRRMFHGTDPSNLLGLLSRGLLLPREAESGWYLQGERRDVGMLGAGIYFTDDAYSAAQYCVEHSGYRYMLIAEVALGNIHHTKNFDVSLTKPPNGFSSVHGIRGTEFKDDEYVVYNKDQQKLVYLVQFHFNEEKKPENLNSSSEVSSISKENQKLEKILQQASKIFFMQENNLLEAKQDANRFAEEFTKTENQRQNIIPELGLVSSSGTNIPLKSTHIRANLLDQVGTVEIYQEYKNESKQTIEAKYVFPLDEKSAVCGFEAYINDKHIIGKVKEKQKAHREYRRAVQQGHGAYLMDQNEKPDSWTVSIGNLPSSSRVIIKITYVTELEIDDDDILFHFPASITSSETQKVSQETTQTDTETNLFDSNTSALETFKLTFQMPFEVLRLYSPSHGDCFDMKITDTMGTIQLKSEIESLGGKDLEFRISIANAHEPRMWIEEDNNGTHKAAMVCFYPKFEFSKQLDNEFLFIIDRSASMTNSCTIETQRIMQLFLKHLPEQSYFNIICFGSTSEELYFTSKQKSSERILRAHEWIQEKTNHNFGSTDAFNILYRIYLRCNHQRAPRHLIFISDGQIHRFSDVLSLVQQNAHHTHLFTCGIGENVNRHSLYTLSCSGRGATEIFGVKASQQFTDSQKVLRVYEKALQPSLSDVDVEWKGSGAERIQQAPKTILSVFNGQRKVIYGMLGDELCDQVILSSRGADGEQMSCRVASHTVGAVRNVHEMIHKLTARALLRDYEEGSYSNDPLLDSIIKSEKKAEMVSLSCKHNVVCSLTSFLAIEPRDAQEIIQSTPSIDELLEKNNCDLISYVGWGEGIEELQKKFCHYQDQKNCQEDLLTANEFETEANEIDLLLEELYGVEERSAADSLDSLLFEIQESLDGVPTVVPIVSNLQLREKCEELLSVLQYAEPTKFARAELAISNEDDGIVVSAPDDYYAFEELLEYAQPLQRVEASQISYECCQRMEVIEAAECVREARAISCMDYACVNESCLFVERDKLRTVVEHLIEPEVVEIERNPSFLASFNSSVLPDSDAFRRPSLLCVPNMNQFEVTEVLDKSDSSISGIEENYEKILQLQQPEGYWELSVELEVLVGFYEKELRKILQNVDYQTLGHHQALQIERLLVTAIIIEIFLSDPRYAVCPEITKAIIWVEQTEKSEVSSCYILGLGSNWRAKSRLILSTRESAQTLNPHITIHSTSMWIGY